VASYVKAQVSVVATLFSDGKVMYSFTYGYRENYLRRLGWSHEHRTVEGTCEPNDLPYVLWSELESEV